MRLQWNNYLGINHVSEKKNIEECIHNYKIIDFMRWDHIAFSLSGILLAASIVAIIKYGFNWGFDFIGGTVIECSLEKSPDIDQIRIALKNAGFKNSLVQNFGSSRDIIIRISPGKDGIKEGLGKKVLKLINGVTGQSAILKRLEFAGPGVGNNMAQEGGVALLWALICILVYVSFRFEWRLATGVVLALLHDVIITLGALALFNVEFDLMIISALMSVIGYSLNDSIVVSDRIRENFQKIHCTNTYDVFNLSLTQTFSRTIITSAITSMLVLILLIFGGEMLRDFSITLFIGVLIGTVSSIYVASALALKFGIKREHLIQDNSEKEETY